MKRKKFLKAAVTLAAFGAIFFVGVLTTSLRAQAGGDDSQGNPDEARIKEGFEIAPVPLNLDGKDRNLVGLGSYIVNASASCNDCHDAGATTQFATGGNPFLGQPKRLNPKLYMGGGQDFGPVVPGSPHIISRNLTPDVTGKPAGGRSFSDFQNIMRTGVDLDNLHPTCSGKNTKNCLPPPFDGNLLEIMPWPAFQELTDHEIRAIYEYLSAIPCIAGPPAPSVLHNDCP
jgi:cytochrome c553